MPRGILVYFSIVAAGTMTGPVVGQALGQTPGQAVPQAKTFRPPKMPWGDPDLEGLWPGSVNIPLQRPANMGNRNTLTEQEFAARDEAERKRVADGHWIEYYPASYQASLVVDPPDGRIPPMTPEAAKRNKEMRDGLGPPSLAGVEQRADSWEDFDLWGRCTSPRGSLAPLLPRKSLQQGTRTDSSSAGICGDPQ